MVNTQVSGMKRFAIAAFTGVMALSLMVPTQLAFADFGVGDNKYSGTEDANGEGAEGGTWAYTAEDEEMTLVDYVGDAIYAVDQDLSIILNGENTVNGGINVIDGNLYIAGDNAEGSDTESSLLINGSAEAQARAAEDPSIVTNATISAYCSDADWESLDLLIKNANISFLAGQGSIGSLDVTIANSKITRGEGNQDLTISGEVATNANTGSVYLFDSDVEATKVSTNGDLFIKDSNLTVAESERERQRIASQIQAGNLPEDYKWVEHAVTATLGIKGNISGTVAETTYKDQTYFYLSSGSEDNVTVKPSTEPESPYKPKPNSNKRVDEGTGVTATGDVIAEKSTDEREVVLTVSKLAVDDMDVATADAKAAAEKAGALTADVYDVTLDVLDADGEVAEHLTSGFSLALTFPVDPKYNGYTATITQVHDGVALASKTATVANGAVSTDVDCLSQFVVSVNPKPAQEGGGAIAAPKGGSRQGDSKSGKMPATGDPLPVPGLCALAALAGLALIAGKKVAVR